MNCIDVIFFQAELTPEKIAVVAQGTVISYRRLMHGIISAQRRFTAAGLAAGQTVGLMMSHPIDHMVVACALHRMKITSASISAAPDLYLDRIAFDAVLSDNVTPIVTRKQPGAKLYLVDTSWFQDDTTFSVAERSGASRDNDWVCRRSCVPDDDRLPPVTDTTASSLEAQLIGQQLCAPADWERMIVVASPWSDSGYLNGLSALYQGRTVCFSEPATARRLIVAFKHHYLVGAAADFVPLLTEQSISQAAMPALRCACIEGLSFSETTIAQVLTQVSSNTVLSYRHPVAGVIAFGAANRVRAVPGGVGYVAPWMDVEIVDGGRKPVGKGEVGEIRVRRRTDMQSVWRSSGAAGDGWIYPGQRGRRQADGLLVVGG